MDGTDRREGAGPWTKRLQHTDEALYRALVENLPAVIYQVAPDDDRRTMYVSPHVETALGYSRDEWLGQPDIWMELLHPDDREQTLAAHDLHNETGRPWSREYRLIANDGRVVWFRDVANLVRDDDGRPQHWLGVQLDITELKGVEGELRAARDELERRVVERTAELEEANALMALEIGERRRAEAELRGGRAPVPAPRRADPGRDLHLGGEPFRRRPAAVLHEPADRAAPRVHGRRMARVGGLLDVPPASGRPPRRHRRLPAFGDARASPSRWSSATSTRTVASSGWPTRPS